MTQSDSFPFIAEAKKGGSSSRGSSSKGSSSKGSSSKGTYSNVGSSSSSSYGSSNKGIGGGYSGGSSSSYGSKSKGIMSNKVVKTATKVAGAYVAYKVARKGVKYAGKGLKYSAFGGGGWHPYRYRMGYYRPPIFVPVGRYRDRHYYSNYNQESKDRYEAFNNQVNLSNISYGCRIAVLRLRRTG